MRQNTRESLPEIVEILLTLLIVWYECRIIISSFMVTIMRHDPELSSCSIVLIGLFNPAIFHPAWLKAKNIHPEVDESPTNLQVVHNDFAGHWNIFLCCREEALPN